MHHVCHAVDRMCDTRVRFKCAKAVRLCAARGLHVRFGTKPIPSQRARASSVGKNPPSFSFCQVDMYAELRDRDYEDRLRTLKLPSLYYRRARGDMIEAYKFTHSIYKTEQEPLQRETNTTTRGHSYKLKKERCNTRTRANFFRHRITNRWNNLCDDVVTAPSLNSFKSRLDHQWCAYKYSNNNDFPPMRTNIKAVQTG